MFTVAISQFNDAVMKTAQGEGGRVRKKVQGEGGKSVSISQKIRHLNVGRGLPCPKPRVPEIERKKKKGRENNKRNVPDKNINNQSNRSSSHSSASAAPGPRYSHPVVTMHPGVYPQPARKRGQKWIDVVETDPETPLRQSL